MFKTLARGLPRALCTSWALAPNLSLLPITTFKMKFGNSPCHLLILYSVPRFSFSAFIANKTCEAQKNTVPEAAGFLLWTFPAPLACLMRPKSISQLWISQSSWDNPSSLPNIFRTRARLQGGGFAVSVEVGLVEEAPIVANACVASGARAAAACVPSAGAPAAVAGARAAEPGAPAAVAASVACAAGGPAAGGAGGADAPGNCPQSHNQLADSPRCEPGAGPLRKRVPGFLTPELLACGGLGSLDPLGRCHESLGRSPRDLCPKEPQGCHVAIWLWDSESRPADELSSATSAP